MLDLLNIVALGSFNVHDIIANGGILLVSLIIFSESGMFVGFFFPGDTLLLSAGIAAAAGQVSLALLLPSLTCAAILGDNIGYLIGKKYGRPLFEKPDGIVFNPKHLHTAEGFFWKYGSKAMLVTHFVPIVRSFAPAAAGISGMDQRKFIFFDAIGVLMWTTGVTLLGYFFGARIPNIEHYISYILMGVVAVSLLVAGKHLFDALREKKKIQKQLEETNQKQD